MLARKLIDLGDAKTAYRVVREAAPPANPHYRAEFHFMAGWIALRFLGDPSTRAGAFPAMSTKAPLIRLSSRAPPTGGGRAAEAAGEFEGMRAQYEAAARYPTAYYGQLARARLGLEEIASNRSPPERGPIAHELQRAADILYSIGERGSCRVVHDRRRAEESSDATAIAALGQLTERYNDARAMLLIGKVAPREKGSAMEQYAFSRHRRTALQRHRSRGRSLHRVLDCAGRKAPSDQRDMSPAKAVGLMQVTPDAGRDTAKRFGVAYDWNRPRVRSGL